jgi:hypothetical protein
MGFIAPVLSAIGEGAGTAASAVGSALEAIPGVGTGVSGLESLAKGIGSAVTGGTPSEASYLASLGQAVPEGVDLVGPSSTFTGPGFLSGFKQGFTGAAQQYANPSAATQASQGLGQLFDAINQARGTAAMPPMVPLPPSQRVGGPATRVTPPAPVVTPQQGPIMKLIGQLFAGF